MTTDGTQILEPQTLPSDLATCHALIQVQREHLDNATRKLTQMEHQLQQLLRRMYGRSSEKIDPKQLALFAEMLKQLEAQNPPAEELPAAPPTTTTKSTTTTIARTRRPRWNHAAGELRCRSGRMTTAGENIFRRIARSVDPSRPG